MGEDAEPNPFQKSQIKPSPTYSLTPENATLHNPFTGLQCVVKKFLTFFFAVADQLSSDGHCVCYSNADGSRTS